MGQMIRQIGPNTTRYYWYPGDKKEWLRALLAVVAGGAVLGLSYLFLRSWLVSTVLGLSAASGVFGFNLGRRDLAAAEALNARTPRREAASAAGRATWRGLAEGAAAAFAALIIVHLPATGVVADWLLPLVPAMVGGLSRQAGLLTVRLSHQSERASEFAGPDAARRDPEERRDAEDEPTRRMGDDPDVTVADATRVA
ncbi:hypothetical protein AB0M46_42535 [Dactylosporangium sp. NPDC051485]|uniref:hypothetical protein n=1 Tax=Dactylosporangium sp. NPDC051485 TaxID=3154846 RepID=UPI0034379871